MKRGITLVEIMVSLLILSVFIVGIVAFYGRFITATSAERRRAEENTNIALTLTIIDRDIKMAGFATPDIIKVASEDGTGLNGTDRLFIADGWEMMRDFTDNGDDDGVIPQEPIDIYSTITTKAKEGGYFGATIQNAGTGNTSIVIQDTDINSTGDGDIKENSSIIIQAMIGGAPNGLPEGYRTTNIAPLVPPPGFRINLRENLRREYLMNSMVVPSFCYYIQRDNEGFWLFRNNIRVLPDVRGFQVEYGYDGNNDRILEANEWVNRLPPAYTNNPNRLRAIRVSLGVRSRFGNREKVSTHTITSDLRN